MTHNGIMAAGGGAVLGGILGKASIPDNMQPQVETPRFMMKIDGVTSSTVEKFEEALEIISFVWAVSREASPHATGHLFSSGRIVGHDIQIIVPRSVQVMNLVTLFSKGQQIPQIIIDELATIGENSVSIETSTFDICYITSVEKVTDSVTGLPTNYTRLVFRYSTYTQEFHEFDQEGTATGSNATTFNFRTAVGGEGGGAA